MFKTKNDVPEATRVKAVELLNARLADCIDLQTQTKQAHWNVKGPNFIALHELFDKVNEEVEDYVDDIAERAVQLGGVAEGTARMVAKRSSLTEYPVKAADGRSHVEALSSALARVPSDRSFFVLNIESLLEYAFLVRHLFQAERADTKFEKRQRRVSKRNAWQR